MMREGGILHAMHVHETRIAPLISFEFVYILDEVGNDLIRPFSCGLPLHQVCWALAFSALF